MEEAESKIMEEKERVMEEAINLMETGDGGKMW